MKIVLDTNVLIEGLKDEYSYEKRIIDEVRRGNLEAFANRQTLQENVLILDELVDNAEYRNQIDEFFAKVRPVINRRRIHIVADEEDNKILESAVEAQAEYLITNDKDLLAIRRFQGVEIVKPQRFWSEYTEEEGDGMWQQWTQYINSQRSK